MTRQKRLTAASAITFLILLAIAIAIGRGCDSDSEFEPNPPEFSCDLELDKLLMLAGPESDFNVRMKAVYCLGQKGEDARSLTPQLIELFEDAQKSEESLTVASALAIALGKIGNPDAKEALEVYKKRFATSPNSIHFESAQMALEKLNE